MNGNQSYIIKHLHIMFIRHAEFDGKITRKDLLAILCQRLGKLDYESKEGIIGELKQSGVIIGETHAGYIINKQL